MRIINRSALVPYSADDMFALVEDIESYPAFLPWCNDAVVHSRDGNVVEATLELHRGKLSSHFRTRNTLQPGVSMGIALVGGPFRNLEGGWRFQVLGAAGCKVSLDLRFEFESRVLDMMFGTFFEDTCNSLVAAFAQRARDVYGAKHTDA